MRLTRGAVVIMSFAVGATVANLYYNQPLLEQIRLSFGVSVAEVAWIPTLTQIGYAVGMLFLVPLGDMLERRRLVVVFTFLSSLGALATAWSPNFIVLAVASLALGAATMTPQLIIPFAAHLAPPNEKGKIVGMMMSGLLLGILLARTVSGFIGAAFGWRALYAGVAIFLILLSAVLAMALPKSAPSYQGNYLGLLKSVAKFFKTEPVLREAALFGAMLFGAFSVFWATLIHLMESAPFHLGSRAVGLYGLLGAGAAGLGPWVGKLADQRDARQTTGFMIGLTLLSFGVFLLSASSLLGIGIGVLIMDVGVQSGHISNQSRIFGLVPGAQSRLQTAYMFCYFVGGALGSALGGLGFSHYQWPGVCAAATLMLIVALIKFLFYPALRRRDKLS